MVRQTQLSQYVWRVQEACLRGLHNTYRLSRVDASGQCIVILSSESFKIDDRVRLLAVNVSKDDKLVREGIEIVWLTEKGPKGPSPVKMLDGNI